MSITTWVSGPQLSSIINNGYVRTTHQILPDRGMNIQEDPHQCRPWFGNSTNKKNWRILVENRLWRLVTVCDGNLMDISLLDVFVIFHAEIWFMYWVLEKIWQNKYEYDGYIYIDIWIQVMQNVFPHCDCCSKTIAPHKNLSERVELTDVTLLCLWSQ